METIRVLSDPNAGPEDPVPADAGGGALFRAGAFSANTTHASSAQPARCFISFSPFNFGENTNISCVPVQWGVTNGTPFRMELYLKPG